MTNQGENRKFAQAYEMMLLARLLDDKFAALYRAGKIHGGVFLGRGQEALSAALGVHLQKGDVFAPLIRDQAGRLAFGESILDPIRTYLGSPLGPMRARDGNVHRGRPREGIFPMISHLGAMISLVCGTLFARKLRGQTGTVGATSIGDGGTSTGAWHEAMNMAAVEKLPLIMVVANNQFAYSTPTERQFACKDLVDRAIGYGIRGYSIEGNDLAACMTTLEEAVSRARNGEGPQMVVASLLRLSGHGEHDDAYYIPDTMKASLLGIDCMQIAEQQVIERGDFSEESIKELKEKFQKKINEAVAQVQQEAPPDPFTEDWCALSSRSLRDGFYNE